MMPTIQRVIGRVVRLVMRRISWPVRWLRYRTSRLKQSPLVAPTEPAPPFGLFKQIAVVAQERPYHYGHWDPEKRLISGPVFPELGVEPWMRHCIYNFVYDVTPEAPTASAEPIDRPCVWLGYMQMQFGHLVAEHMTRVLWSRVSRPDDLYLYVLPPALRGRPLDFHFRDLLAWYGVPPGQLRQVIRPVIAKELRVYPQSELLEGAGPSGQYLDLLDRHVAGIGLRPDPANLLFVTRAGMLAHRTGSHAGEGYLRGLLRAQGIAILDPARAPLKRQLAAYSGARTIVFSEGSAMHGRQLLGRVRQDIVVLNRRNGARTAVTALSPRCRSLRYIEVSPHAALPVTDQGDSRPADALALYDVSLLLDVFASLGADIRNKWRPAEYAAAVREDAELWAGQLARAGRGYDACQLRAVADVAVAASLS